MLSTTSQAFARKFGVSLGDLDRILGGRIPKSLDGVKAAIGRAEGEQRQFTRSILGGKAASDELTRQLGIIGRDWHARIVLDGYGTAMARLDSYSSKLASIPGLESAAMAPQHRATGGPVKAGRPYIVGERGPEVMVPKVNGHILPKIPGMPKVETEDWGDPGGLTIVVQSVLDGKVIAENTIEHIRYMGARA